MFVETQDYFHRICDLYSQYYANIIGSGLVFEAGGVVGTTPQKFSICCSTPEAIACLDFK